MNIHFEILGKDFKEEQLLNISFILIILLIFHFEISGKDAKEEHP